MAKLAERSVQIFQSPRGTLQNYQPFRMRHSSFRSGNFSPVTAWPKPSSVTSRQNGGGSRPYTDGGELPGAGAPTEPGESNSKTAGRNPCLLAAPGTRHTPAQVSGPAPCRAPVPRAGPPAAGAQAEGYATSQRRPPCQHSKGLMYKSPVRCERRLLRTLCQRGRPAP